jgi:long-subunit acyl-CoA synthetase (AMP-forming)
LFDDIKELRPTFLVFPPRIYSQLCSDAQETMNLELRNSPSEMHEVIKEKHRKLIRENFGGRVRAM